ncbi:MAG: GMC family oxidoreductase N-terminal domain-containing protein [Novosphingobium sp.]|uniref:GMC family oxidoreductase n=1 Tax=Novosphingobium sp. TaxID=1874826 RepID=UPI003017B8C7
MTQAFDYIVIGAGAAGSVVASRLAARPGLRVLVLEAGGTDRRLWVRVPIGYGRTFNDPTLNWCYRSAPVAGLGGRAVYLPRGKVIGGSSSINAMVYCRGVPGDFDDWRDAGNSRWGWADVVPAFEAIERRIGPDGASEGSGPLTVADRSADYHPFGRHFLAAAGEAGFVRIGDLNAPPHEGVAPYHLNIQDGRRFSAADAFLRPALATGRVGLVKGAEVERIGFEGRRARTVRYHQGGAVHEVRAEAEIILCAGAVGSPALLLRSGVGTVSDLKALGIAPVAESPHVGANLQDHIGIDYFYRTSEPTLNRELAAWPARIRAGLRYVLSRKGPLSLSVNQYGGLVRSDPALARPDVQLYCNPLTYSKSGTDKREILEPDRWDAFTLGFSTCRPQSRGRVTLAGPDPRAAPVIQPDYLASEADRAGVLASARLIARIAATPAMTAVIERPYVFDPAGADDEALLADFRARSGTVHHLCGTCRMAPADRGGVVGSDLSVHGTEGLRVIDASAFPNITSANTLAPTVMLAWIAAGRMLEQNFAGTP